VGFIDWGEIKSGLVLRGEGVQLLLHNTIWHQSRAWSKSGLAFLLTFFNIKVLKNYTYYSIEKIMEDSEGPSAKIGI
jgi:CRISPR/Cas system-associated protein Csx1